MKKIKVTPVVFNLAVESAQAMDSCNNDLAVFTEMNQLSKIEQKVFGQESRDRFVLRLAEAFKKHQFYSKNFPLDEIELCTGEALQFTHFKK